MRDDVVPLSAILALSHRGTKRHPAKAAILHASSSTWNSRQLPVIYQRHERDEPGNLEMQEYQFWAGAPNQDDKWARCRVCGVVVFGEPARKQHFKKFTCGTNMRRILTYITKELKPPRCLICGFVTYNERWGAPLCDYRCRGLWMFQRNETPAIDRIKRLLQSKGSLLQEKA